MLFVSKIKELRLIKKPASKVIDANGQPYYTPGERVEFSNFRFSTSNEELIDWLLNHEMYGRTFTSDKVKDQYGKKFVKDKKYMTDQEILASARETIKDYDKSTITDPFKHALKKKQLANAPQMIQGMIATAQLPPGEMPPSPETKAKGITKEEIADMIKSEVNSAMSQVVELIKAGSKKAAFHCPECGEEFPSGVAVGRHKKAVHAGPATTPEVKE